MFSANSIKRLFNNPLFHFIIGGAVIFIFVTINQSGEPAENDNPHHITIDRETLLKQIQYASKAFDPDKAEMKLDAMSNVELAELVQQYRTEEVFFREAEMLGLGDNDSVIKKRMIEKMEFIIKGGNASDIEVTSEEIQRYYEAKKAQFIAPSTVTFTHVFIKNDAKRTEQETSLLLKQLATKLKQDQAQFSDAVRYGDRFPLFLNYVDKNQEEVAAHFGAEFTANVFNLVPNDNQWQGPFSSKLGQHMVLVTKSIPTKQLDLDDVKYTIKENLQRSKQTAARAKSIEQLVKNYTVDVQQPLQKGEQGL